MTDDTHPAAHPALAAIVAGHAGLMIDVTGANLPGLLAALGGRYPETLAGYVTGTAGVDWPGDEWGKLHPHVGLFRYDQSPGLSLFASGAADGADIERGAGTVGSFIDGARKREAKSWHSWAYISQADYPALAAEVKSAGLRLVQYGIANWNDSLAQAQAALGGTIAYVQWASPSSNPQTPVPGAGGKTLAQLNVDLNATLPGWFVKPKPPAPRVRGVVVTADLASHPATSPDSRTWTVTG
jgi:hypothetical protein